MRDFTRGSVFGFTDQEVWTLTKVVMFLYISNTLVLYLFYYILLNGRWFQQRFGLIVLSKYFVRTFLQNQNAMFLSEKFHKNFKSKRFSDHNEKNINGNISI